MNFYDVLAAKNWSGGNPTTNFFDLLFAQSMGGGEQWQTYEGTLPATFNANGDDMRQYQIYGNVGGVGDVTVNYLNYRKIDYTHIWDSYGQSAPTVGNNLYASPMIAVVAGKTYIRTYNLSPIGNVFFTYDAQKNFISRNTAGNGVPFTIADGVAYIAYNIEVSNNYKAGAYMLTEGTTPPASYEPYGYKLDMNVRSLNIYNSAETSWSAGGTILNDSGEPISSEGSHYITNFIPCEPGEVYYLAGSLADKTRWRVYFYDANKNWIRRTGSKSPGGSRLIAMDANATYFQLQVGTDIVSTSDWNFVHSRTAPEKYQPYLNITKNMFIGDAPLQKDEYVDYQAGKIYRMNGGTLTPTDPPVALPALPTCEGETVIDYAGESVAPEKVVLEYKKGGN